MYGKVTTGFGLIAILGAALNLAFWCGLIYFALWALRHFALI